VPETKVQVDAKPDVAIDAGTVSPSPEDYPKDHTAKDYAKSRSKGITENITRLSLIQTPPEDATDRTVILLTDVINHGLKQLPKGAASRLEDLLLQYKDGHPNAEVNLLLQYLLATMPKK
jgi:hypothetical protein